MCDYSLGACKTRDAKVGDQLVSGSIKNSHQQQTMTNGFYAGDAPDVAVCLRPGTELAFDAPVSYSSGHGFFFSGTVKSKHSTAIFRELNTDKPMQHHDAIEFPDGTKVLLTQLLPGQSARVLQLGVDPKLAKAENQTFPQPAPEVAPLCGPLTQLTAVMAKVESALDAVEGQAKTLPSWDHVS